MAYASVTHSYSGGARTFSTGFATGVRAAADIKVAVTGETDGEGNQVYRAFTYDANTGIVTVTNAINGPYPREVVITRDTPITNPTVDFSAGAVISRANLQKAVLQVLRGVQEAHDNDALIEERVYNLEQIDGDTQVAEAQAAADAAAASAVAANQSRIDADQAKDDTETLRDEVEVLVTTIVGDSGRFCTAVAAGGNTYYSLTPSIPVTVLTDGLRLSFIAPSTLIAASPQVRLPGLGGNIPVFNNTGEIVPPDYIRVGYRTELTYDEFSGGFLASRPVVHVETVNGTYIQFEDGTMICGHSLTGQPTTTAQGALFASDPSTTWTFPKPFLTGTFPVCHADSNVVGRWANACAVNSTQCLIRDWGVVSSASTFMLRVSAIGRWY